MVELNKQRSSNLNDYRLLWTPTPHRHRHRTDTNDDKDDVNDNDDDDHDNHDDDKVDDDDENYHSSSFIPKICSWIRALLAYCGFFFAMLAPSRYRSAKSCNNSCEIKRYLTFSYVFLYFLMLPYVFLIFSHAYVFLRSLTLPPFYLFIYFPFFSPISTFILSRINL